MSFLSWCCLFVGCLVADFTYHLAFSVPMKWRMRPSAVFGMCCMLPSVHIPLNCLVCLILADVSYKPKDVEGAPCHVQSIGRRLRDEASVLKE